MIDIKKHFILSWLFLTFPLWYLVSSQSLRLPSPASYSVASPELSERVALRPEQMLKNKELLEEQQVKSKIWKVISRHRTGLATESLEQIPHQIYQESKNYGYDPLLLTALIVTESSFNNFCFPGKTFYCHTGGLRLDPVRDRRTPLGDLGNFPESGPGLPSDLAGQQRRSHLRLQKRETEK